ncbi:MAG: ATP-dependent RecD-like DNA helicase [Thermodesulfovibrionales bacterium]
MPEELQGQLERITFQSEETHYTIAKLTVKGRKDPITAVGTLFSVAPGEILKLTGSWEKHPKYGPQFKFESYETVIPATEKGIEQYLGSGLIRGIGPVMAKRLVEKFGTATIEVIENEIGRLSEVGGIGEKRIAMIRAAWAEQKEVRNVMVFLQGHDVSPAYAIRIYRHYGKEAVRLLRENPYRLSDDIFGIGFLTADRIAGKLGIPRDSVERAEAGMLYILGQASSEGHVYLPYETLIGQCAELMSIGREILLKAFAQLAQKNRIVAEDIGSTDDSVNDKAVYPAEFYAAETSVGRRLAALLCGGRGLLRYDREQVARLAAGELGITLAENQNRAVEEALRQKVLVITGGPGTGKTTIINAIIRIFRSTGRTVLLAAPTGRAAKRMTEATGMEAKTIHRLLEYSPKNGGFKRNDTEQLDAHLVVVDEASMIDTMLMHHFLKAVPGKATLILVGDVDQLPSVGAGNVLKDIIDSGRIPTVRLNEIFRQAGESLIVSNAHRINRGEFPEMPEGGDALHDFYFIECEDPEKVLEKIVHLCTNRIPERFGFNPLSEIQVLTPMHRGAVGTANLNAELQKSLNPDAADLVRGGRTFRKGDKVMQIRNNYDRDVYNGDIGRISGIDREGQELLVDFDGKAVAYDFSDLDELVLAYAISVHKSQGSEYPAVVMPLLTQHYLLLHRNLLYTAVTRGRKLVVIVGTKKALGIAIRNNKPQIRYTRLKERLRNP